MLQSHDLQSHDLEAAADGLLATLAAECVKRLVATSAVAICAQDAEPTTEPRAVALNSCGGLGFKV